MGKVPKEIRRLFEDPLALGEALGYKGDALGRKVFGELHRGIVDHALSQPWTYCVVPRGHAKSTLLSVILPIWKLLNNPDRRILVASATLELAKRMIGEIRDKLNGTIELKPGLFVPVAEVFPHLALDRNDTRSQGPTQKLNIAGRSADGGREPSIFAGAVTSNLAGNHPTDAHFDDLCNEQNSRTYSQRQKVIEFVQQAVPLMRYQDSPITLIGTPWAFGDIVDYLGQHTGWAGMRYGVWDGNPPNPQLKGKGPGPQGAYPLCESFLTANEINQIQEDVSKVFFAAQYLCAPIPAEEALFERGLVAEMEYPDLPENAKGLPEVLIWDPVHRLSGPRQTGRSLNGLLTVKPVSAAHLGLKGYEPDRNIFFITGAYEVAGGLDEAIQFVEDLILQRRDHGPAPIKSVWIEKEAGQEALKPWLEERGRISGVRIRAKAIKKSSLTYRLMGLVTATRKGLLRMPQSFLGKELLSRRLLEYPLSDSDDLLAALSLLSSSMERRGPLPDLEVGGRSDPALQIWH